MCRVVVRCLIKTSSSPPLDKMQVIQFTHKHISPDVKVQLTISSQGEPGEKGAEHAP